MVIEGPAGIGKTTLLDALRHAATDRGFTALSARAVELEGANSWGVLRQLVEPALRADEGVCREPLSDAASLAWPALSRQLDARPAAEDAYAILHGLYWQVADLAHRGPVLLAIDDLQWSDGPTLRFVAYLNHRLEGLPILLGCTLHRQRCTDRAGDDIVAALVADPRTQVLRPSPLSPDACRTLLRDGLGHEPAQTFETACRDMTGGNPFLLCSLIESLRDEAITGDASDAAHVRRMTPSAISRNVVLRLGRLPPETLAVSRAIAVLGSAATLPRVATLAELGAECAADTVAVLMSEGLLAFGSTIRFAHPLIGSAVYSDLAPPIRRLWHRRAAMVLVADGAPIEDIGVQLLSSDASGDGQVAALLLQAADTAASRGAPDIARRYLQRALVEPPPDELVGGLLLQLGLIETQLDPPSAVAHLQRCLELCNGSRRTDAAVALSHALVMAGRYSDAVTLLENTLGGLDDQESQAGVAIRSALLNGARWDLETRDRTRALHDDLLASDDAGKPLDPRLHANLAIERCAAGQDRSRATAHARAATKAIADLMLTSATVLPEATSVLVFAGCYDEAATALQRWSDLVAQRGWAQSAAVVSTVASLLAIHRGRVSSALASARQALDINAAAWLVPIGVGFLVTAMIDAGAIADAHAELETHGLAGELADTWAYNVVRHARGRLAAAAGDNDAAIGDLTAAGELAGRWGIANPAMMPWRSDLSSCLLARGETAAARRLCVAELEAARQWGTARAVGISLRALGTAQGGDAGLQLLTESTEVLGSAGVPLELARSRVAVGTALRRKGSLVEARTWLEAGMDLAHQTGGAAMVEAARSELVLAGGRPRRPAVHGRDALTPSQLRTAQLAAAGKTNRGIAQTLFVTQRTVEIHLSAAYSKLGINSRQELAAALGTDSS